MDCKLVVVLLVEQVAVVGVVDVEQTVVDVVAVEQTVVVEQVESVEPHVDRPTQEMHLEAE